MKSMTINNTKHSVNDQDTIQIWLKSIKVFSVNLIINLLVEKWQKVVCIVNLNYWKKIQNIKNDWSVKR